MQECVYQTELRGVKVTVILITNLVQKAVLSLNS